MALKHRGPTKLAARGARALLSVCGLLAGLLPFPRTGEAASNQVAIRYFPDVTISLGGQTFEDQDVVQELRPGGAVSRVNIGAVPRTAALTAYHVRAGGTQWLSFETSVVLPGGLVARPADVVETNADGTAPYTMVFDASANGVRAGTHVDAISETSGTMVLSFDTPVSLAGGLVQVNAEDAIGLSGGVPVFFFDGSAAGVPDGRNLDGLTVVPGNGHILVSFDVGGTVGGVAFKKGDVLEYDPSGDTWEMAYDASTAQPGLAAANLGAADVLTDLDLDGLADVFETNSGVYASSYDTGTNPTDADTDNDGLVDGVETNTGAFVSAQNTGSDPLDADSDGDGFRDGAEVSHGSNPNNPASTPLTAVPSLGPLGLGALALSLLAAGKRALRRRSEGAL